MHILHIHYTNFTLYNAFATSAAVSGNGTASTHLVKYSRSVRVCCDYHVTWRDWSHKIDTYVVPWVLSVFQLPSDTHQKLLPAKHIVRYFNVVNLVLTKFLTSSNLHKPLFDADNISFNPYKYVPRSRVSHRNLMLFYSSCTYLTIWYGGYHVL